MIVDNVSNSLHVFCSLVCFQSISDEVLRHIESTVASAKVIFQKLQDIQVVFHTYITLCIMTTSMCQSTKLLLIISIPCWIRCCEFGILISVANFYSLVELFVILVQFPQ